jgi:hypothetical protein
MLVKPTSSLITLDFVTSHISSPDMKFLVNNQNKCYGILLPGLIVIPVEEETFVGPAGSIIYGPRPVGLYPKELLMKTLKSLKIDTDGIQYTLQDSESREIGFILNSQYFYHSGERIADGTTSSVTMPYSVDKINAAIWKAAQTMAVRVPQNPAMVKNIGVNYAYRLFKAEFLSAVTKPELAAMKKELAAIKKDSHDSAVAKIKKIMSGRIEEKESVPAPPNIFVPCSTSSGTLPKSHCSKGGKLILPPGKIDDFSDILAADLKNPYVDITLAASGTLDYFQFIERPGENIELRIGAV